MTQRIYMGQLGDPEMCPKMIDGMFRLRCEVFYKRLGWDVEVHEGRERDRFDNLDPVYMIASDALRRKVNGCWRLLSTTGPYMLKDIFPELLRGEPAPCDPRVWEISRFATTPTSAKDRRSVSFGPVALQMIRELREFSVRADVRAYIAVTTVEIEAKLFEAGIHTRRFGDGKAMMMGDVLSVACWIPRESLLQMKEQ